jgi:hypothetical protein
MTDWNDLSDEMRRLRLDEDTIDRLLTGRIGPDDAPPGYSEVARVLTSAASTDLRDALAREADHVALAVASVGERAPVSSIDARPRRTRRNRRLKVGGLVLVGAMVGSTGLASAGMFPDAAQDVFAAVLERVGISVPFGGPNDDHPATSGEEISEIATTTDATGVDKGAEISSVASGGMSQAGQHGTDGSGAGGDGSGEAPVPVPNSGGTDTGDVASGGDSAEGTDTADQASEGRSGSGSGNASGAPSPPSVPVPSDVPTP